MDDLLHSNSLPVGVRHFECTDTSRFDRQEGRARRFMVTAFYPAQQDHLALPLVPADLFGPLLEQSLETIARRHNVPLSQEAVEQARTFCYAAKTGLKPELSRAPFPVLICSAAGAAHRLAAAPLCLRLAGRGFVVLSVDHPHDAKVVVYPDGTMCCSELVDENPMLMRLLDLSSLIEQLPTLEGLEFLRGNLAYERLGTLGHSRGGATAVASAFWIDSVKAAINFDGYLFGYDSPELCGLTHYPEAYRTDVATLERPVLRLRRACGDARDVTSFEAESQVLGGPFFHGSVPGWSHGDFGFDPFDPLLRRKPFDSDSPRAKSLADLARLFFSNMLPEKRGLKWLDEARAKFPNWTFRVKSFAG